MAVIPNTLAQREWQLNQWKRQAKLVRREGKLTHSQALDAIAKTQGFNNWGLLAKAFNSKGV